MFRTARQAANLVDAHTRRRLLASIPLTLVILGIELCGFLAMASVVQVLANPAMLQEVSPGTLVGMLRGIVGTDSPSRFVLTVGIVAMVLLVSRGVAASALSWWQAGLLARAEATMSAQIFRNYLAQPYEFHMGRHSADLIRTVLHSVRTMMSRVLMPALLAITELSLVLALAGALLVLEPVLAATSITALGVAMVLYAFVVRRMAHRIGVDDERYTARDQRIVQEGLSAVKVLAVLERRGNVARRFSEARMEHTFALRGLFVLPNLSRYYLEAVILILFAVVAGAAIVESGDGTFASLGVMLAGSMRLLPSVQRLLTAFSSVRSGESSVGSVRQELAHQAPPNTVLEPRDAPATEFTGTVELRDISYHYPTATAPTLRSVNLHVKHGECVGIVGSSGAGKTTLVDIIIGLLQPTSGGVYVDGVRITPEHLPTWRRLIGYVPQDTVIIDDTVRRNVALGLDDDEIDDAAVMEALTQAQLLDSVLAMPNQLDNVLGERGVRLSGGQRQRIGIARALYHRPAVLVLDEATAALDTTTERQIVATLERLRGTITMFIIAHRLSTIEGCDVRVMLADGTIDEIVRLRPEPPAPRSVTQLEHTSAES